MNTLSIIIVSLNTALIAVRTADGFIQDEKVSAILVEIANAIEYALKRLAPHQRAAQEATRAGKPVPATAPRAKASGDEPVDDDETDSGEEALDDDEDAELDS